MMGLKGSLALIGVLFPVLSWGQGTTALLDQIKFTALEVLVYTDQLQRYEQTGCRARVLSNYDLVATQQRLLSQLDPEHRSEFKEFFGSAQVVRLLEENGAGIEAMLGPPQLLGAAGTTLSDTQRAACEELGRVFQDNYLQSQADLQLLLERYRD